ncbi:TVP38/TMEM64 family protein [Desulfogranum japonicum]|uniref:TVP38/TMEM64 family protein n=1 Tax=Desulfogranum japonicum TaxID=231447 RepID=UPI00041760D4|nr:TVP38/TMEM64 family protein [Desulfogranum japonicum]
MTSPALLKKIGLVVVLVVVAGTVAFFDLQRFLDLGYLKEQQAAFQALYHTHPVALLSSYVLAYVLVTALSIPGAAVMTLAGGALFGLVTGTVAVSFASTLGATLACAVARYLLRNWVQGKFGDRLAKINQGIQQDGGWYLFGLRLVPIFPFFVVNLVMGITPIRLRTYAWVSQLGMLPATIVYVNAGQQLAQIDSLKGILSPGLLFSFILLGLLPITTKKILAWITRKRHSSPTP